MFLNKQRITYIFIIIFIIITSLHLYKINNNNNNDNTKELFQELMEEQNLQGFDVYINNMAQVKFGVKPNTRSLLTSMNEKASKEELNTIKTELIDTTQTNLTNAISDKVTKTELNNAMPELSIIAYSGALAPTGWQLCNMTPLEYTNDTLVRPSDPRVVSLKIENGIVYTPDLRGRFILGSNTAQIASTDSANLNARSVRNINAVGGVEKHKLSEGEMPQHKHYVAAFEGYQAGAANFATRNTTEAIAMVGNYSNYNNYVLGFRNLEANTGLSSPIGGSQPHENMPPFYVLTYIIKKPISPTT